MQQRYKDGCDSSLPNSRCNNVTTSLVDATKETPCLQTRAGAKHTSTEAHHRIKDVISPHRLPHSGNRFTSSNYITRSFLVFSLANERERERETGQVDDLHPCCYALRNCTNHWFCPCSKTRSTGNWVWPPLSLKDDLCRTVMPVAFLAFPMSTIYICDVVVPWFEIYIIRCQISLTLQSIPFSNETSYLSPHNSCYPTRGTYKCIFYQTRATPRRTTKNQCPTLMPNWEDINIFNK